MQRVGVEEFLNLSNKGKIVDVRSPAEFKKGHIPGAVNIPIFTNKERAEVGTVYKQESREDAILLGLDIVGPKLRKIADEGKRQAIDNKLFVYCWRGGMRSEKMAWLFDLNGLETMVLEGGYKNYRNYGRTIISKASSIIIIQGPTGSGKTAILRSLAELGEQVIDLEELANHKGSAFGGLGKVIQPSTQQFQNEIYRLINQFDRSRPIWLESESATIGRVYLPEELWQRMNTASIVAVNLPAEIRTRNIISEYGSFSKEELISKVELLKQRLGGAMINEISDDIKQDDLHSAVSKLLVYYDKSYAYSATHNKERSPQIVDLVSEDPKSNAKILLATMKKRLSDED